MHLQPGSRLARRGTVRRWSLWLVAALPLACRAAAEGAAAGATVPPGAPVVVVELFTSQGCSSCPPADRLLRELGDLDSGVVALAFHVDYWDHIGWRDPFSSPRWSGRQQAYARAFGARGVYTPQVVVDGSGECVGSDRRSLLRLIAAAKARPPTARLWATLVAAPAAGAGRVEVEVEATVLRDLPVPEVSLLAAAVESGFHTSVGAGENARRTLDNDFVVRDLHIPLRLTGRAGTVRRERVSVPLEPAWDTARTAVALWLQEPRSMAIHAAALVPLSPAAP